MILLGGLGLGVQTIATVVLARLLSPHDFGVVTMVTTFSLLLANFGLNGFTEAIIQREELNHRLASNLFWINLAAGVTLTTAFASVGSPLARFFKSPELAQVTPVMSTTILLTSISIVHLALLKRAMRFSAVSVNELVARIISVVTSIALGWAGCGYWALVAGCISAPLSVSVGAFALCKWLPGLPTREKGTGSTIRFAIDVYARFGTGYAARNMDNLLVGWRFSSVALGAYKKAYDLFALPANQLVGTISPVAISALSRLSRHKTEYKSLLLATMGVLAFVGMGLSGVLTLVGRDIIQLLLGPKWHAAGLVFTFFAPGIGIMLIYFTHVWIHISIGRTDRSLRWGLVEIVVIGTLFLAGLPWGPVGIAVAWTASFWILAIPAFWYAGEPIDLHLSSVPSAIWRYVLASLAAGLLSATFEARVPWLGGVLRSNGAFARIVIDSTMFSSLYFSFVVLLHWGYTPIRQAVKLLQEMVPWSRSLSPPIVATGAAIEDLSATSDKALLPDGIEE